MADNSTLSLHAGLCYTMRGSVMDYKGFLQSTIKRGTKFVHSLTNLTYPWMGDLPTKQRRYRGKKVVQQSPFTVLDELNKLIPPEKEDGGAYLIEELTLMMEAHAFLTKASQLYNLRRLRIDNPSPEPNPTPSKDWSRLTSSIDPDGLKNLLFQKLEDEQLYLREELTLAMLAHELSVEPHQLTRFLNHYLHTSFHSLINAYRINAAKHRLIHHEPNETILDIAFDVGFNSKASFNRAFKKETSMTPTQYQESIKGVSKYHRERFD